MYDGPRCCSLFGTPQNILTAFLLLCVKILVIILTSATVMYDCSTPRATGDSDAHFSATLIKPTHTPVVTRCGFLMGLGQAQLNTRTYLYNPLVSSSLTDLGALHEKETDQHSFALTFLTHPHRRTHYVAYPDTHRALAH